MKSVHIVEAALFSAGRPVSIEEIAETTELTRAQVTRAVAELQKEYASRDTVLEIGKAGAKWAMQVRRQAAEPAAKFAPMEIAPKLLKTLALIAYHQPMKQSDLAEMIGSKVYDHIPELKERGLVKTRRDGQTKILSTTAAFPEYFGLDALTPDQIRVALAKAVGLDPKAEAKRAGRLEGFDVGGPESATETAETSKTATAPSPPDSQTGGPTPPPAAEETPQSAA